MDRRAFLEGFSELCLRYQPKRDLPVDEHPLFDRVWMRDTREWDGAAWLEAIERWKTHHAWMPKFNELREVYEDVQTRREAQDAGERLALAAPRGAPPTAAYLALGERFKRLRERGEW